MALTDFESILTVIATYAQAIDGRDFDLLASILAPEACLEVGRARFEGRDAVVETIRSSTASTDPGKHVCVNSRLQVDDSTATGTTDYLSFRSDRTLGQTGQYVDQFVKSETGWKIAHRRIIIQLK
jgi:ketosteroid isomerase-like protein